MSYNIVPLDVYRMKDNEMKIQEQRQFAVYEGSAQTSYKNFTTTSYSDTSLQFSTPPPSPGIIVSRKVYLRLKFLINFTGTTTSGNLLKEGFDAPRAFPISKIIETLSCTINNNTATINLADVFSALIRYNTDYKTREFEYSETPHMLDQTQEYGALIGGNRNPLAFYADNPYEVPRGGFPFRIISNTPTSAQVEMTVTEPIFLSPWLFGCGSFPGFIGVQSMSWNFVLSANKSRVWSHADFSGNWGSSGDYSDITNIDWSISDIPALLFKYLTPKEIQRIPQSVSYSWYDIQRYPTNFTSTIGAFRSGAPLNTATIQSNNIQLQSIPKRLYLFCRRNNSSLNATTPDTFLSITNIVVNWNNRSGLLSSASQQDLYNMSKENGLCLSWEQFSGGPLNNNSFVTPVAPATNRAGTVGSVICIEMGKDIGLDSSEAPGMLGTYQLQINILQN